MAQAIAVMAACALGSAAAHAQEIIIWHDKGDDGLKMVQQMAELYAKDHPGVTVKSLSMPTDQWFSRSIAALNTGTSPDILFNDNPRIVRIQQTTGKLADLTPQLAQLPADDRKSLSAGDVAASTFQGRVLQIPFQRTITGLGIRTSWLAKAGEQPPKTWEDVLRIGHKFQAADPNTFALAMQGADAASMLGGGIDLLVLGNGFPHPLVDENGEIVIDRPEIARIVIAYLKLYTTDKLVSPDTINQTFTDMYQLIEGGRVGMFRVGNWNVGKWDKSPPAGDYAVHPYPAIGNGHASLVVGSVRGMAVPDNAPHKAAALEFVKFIVSKQAQQISLANMGGVVRSDLDTSAVTPGLKPFLSADANFTTDDFASSQFPWYLKLQDGYYRLLIQAINDPPKDWDAWVHQTAAKLREQVTALKSKT